MAASATHIPAMESPYDKLRERRAIINRKALIAALDGLLAAHPDLRGGTSRAPVLACLKEAMEAGRSEIRRRFEAGGDGRQVTLGTAYLMDQIVKVLFDFANEHAFPTPNPTAAEQIRSPISTCCSCGPTSRPRAASRSSSTCSTRCGTCA